MGAPSARRAGRRMGAGDGGAGDCSNHSESDGNTSGGGGSGVYTPSDSSVVTREVQWSTAIPLHKFEKLSDAMDI